jgi:N6-adenosine-specific RNA methylase IME4
MTSPKFHPLANIFPLMEGEPLAELAADIKVHGVREMIVTLDDLVLDGRNRVRAAAAARVTIPPSMFRAFDPKVDGDPLAFVISANIKRRHLSTSQRAWIASSISTMRQGERTDLEPSAELRKVDQPAAAKMLNVSERSVQNAAVVRAEGEPELQHAVEQGHLKVALGAKAAKLEPRLQREIAKDAREGNERIVRVVVKQEMRRQKMEALGDKIRDLPDKKFAVIYADPPWRFETWGGAAGALQLADNHYATMSLEKIEKLPVASICADDCVLFLWATAPMLMQAESVMLNWGFHPTTHCVWNKTKRGGMGYWFINKHELLLVGTKGNIPAPAPGTQWSSVIDAPIGRHSEKPAIFAEMIESYFRSLPKVELFRRGKPRPGWDAWGAESEEAA